MINFFRKALEIIAWLNIFASIQLVFVFIGYLVYSIDSTFFYKILAIIVALAGLIIGVYVAERIRKSIGCSTLIFRVKSSPDIDKLNKKAPEEEKEKK